VNIAARCAQFFHERILARFQNGSGSMEPIPGISIDSRQGAVGMTM
jgi:hypothetical protein